MPYGLDCAICGQCTPLFATYSEMRSWMICAGWEMTEPNAQRAFESRVISDGSQTISSRSLSPSCWKRKVSSSKI